MKRFMKRNLTICFLFACIFSMGFQCRKEPVNFSYNFRADADIYPLKKIYSLTDTIWIETDLPNKFLFDTRSNQNVNADTGQISLMINYNEFASVSRNPSNGLCDVITINGVNKDRNLFPGGVQTFITYGCGQPNYKTRIGFKPNYKGIFRIQFLKDQIFQNCSGKIIKYYATISFRFKSIDLNLDILNSLPEKERDGKEGTQLYTQMINNREMLVFKVE